MSWATSTKSKAYALGNYHLIGKHPSYPSSTKLPRLPCSLKSLTYELCRYHSIENTRHTPRQTPGRHYSFKILSPYFITVSLTKRLKHASTIPSLNNGNATPERPHQKTIPNFSPTTSYHSRHLIFDSFNQKRHPNSPVMYLALDVLKVLSKKLRIAGCCANSTKCSNHVHKNNKESRDDLHKPKMRIIQFHTLSLWKNASHTNFIHFCK